MVAARGLVVVAATAAALALTGCGSTAGTTATTSPTNTPSESTTTALPPLPSTEPTRSGTGSSGTSPQQIEQPDVLVSGSWLLEHYQLTNDGGWLGADTTVRNRGSARASADFTMTLTVGGLQVAVLHGAAADVPAGAAVPVRFTGTDGFVPGHKVVVFSATPR